MDTTTLQTLLTTLGVSKNQYTTDPDIICFDLESDGRQWYNQFQYDFMFDFAYTNCLKLRRIKTELASTCFFAYKIKTVNGVSVISAKKYNERVGSFHTVYKYYREPLVGDIVYVESGDSATITEISENSEAKIIKLNDILTFTAGEKIYYRVDDNYLPDGQSLISAPDNSNIKLRKIRLTDYEADIYISFDAINGIELSRATTSQNAYVVDAGIKYCQIQN